MGAPETAITADLVREALAEQHPDLAGLSLREVAGGWGNQMWRLGDDLAVRVQRMDPTPESSSSRNGGGCPCSRRACRFPCRRRCGTASRRRVSRGTGRS